MRLLRLAGAVTMTAMYLTAACDLATAAPGAEQIVPPSRRPSQSAPHNRSDRAKPQPELNTLNDIYTAIHRCYQAPPPDQAKPGMRVTVQFTYSRDGELFGKPRILYESPDATPVQQSAYRSAVAAALVRCTPLPFSKSLGNAVAGRVLSIQFIDDRSLKGAAIPHLPPANKIIANLDRSNEWPLPKTH